MCALGVVPPILQALMMLVLDRQNDVTSQARAGAGRIQLRMRPDGQLLELPEGKTTIGSSPRCNVRIEQAGVQPLHCLIVNSAEGLRVRSWAANAKLNGEPFVEAGLSPGDCVSVGPVEFEIVDTQTPEPTLQTVQPAPAAEGDSIKIRLGRDLARGRARQLLDALRRQRVLCGEFQGQIADLQEGILQGIDEGNGISGKLENAKEELAFSVQQVAEYERELALVRQQLAKYDDEIVSSSRKIAAYEEELASGRVSTAEYENIARQRDELLKDNEELRGEVNGSRDEIARLVSERDRNAEEHHKLAFSCAALRDQHQSLTVENYQRINEDDSRVELLEARLAEVTEENSCLAAEKASLAGEHAELRCEISHLAVIEREMSAAIDAKNSIADELQRALLQVAELRDWETRAQEILTNNHALREEHDRLLREVAELRELPNDGSDERDRLNDAWQALTAEAARLSESREELSLENARLREALVSIEQQLTESQHTQLNGADAVAVERQRLAAEAEATIAAAVAEMERRLADQSHQYTESFELIREELAAALEARQSVEAEVAKVHESREELADENARLRIALDEIQQQLAENQQAQTKVGPELDVERQRLAAEAEATIATAVAEMERRVAEQKYEYTESLKAIREELAAAVEAWQSLERAREDWQRQSAEAAEFQADQAKKIAVLEERLATIHAVDEHSIGHERFASGGIEAVVPNEEQSRRSAAAAEPSRGLKDATDYLRSIGVLAEGLGETTGVVEPVEGIRHEKTAAAVAEDAAASERSVATGEALGDKPPEQTSFIDRYSHMFVDDDRASGEQRTSGAQTEVSRASANPDLSRGSDPSSSPKSTSPKDEDEESIEQYMAKLLERVRGDSKPSSTFVPAPVAPLNTPSVADEEATTLGPAPLPVADETPATNAPVARDVARRKSTAEARTDLGALRALANETARRAISQSELKKHRRNSVTKVIVSTLAGVTSLWLMLDSPDFKDIQFITACVSLVVAAIWAWETFRTLLDSLRAATYDGPEAEAGALEDGDGLPIDLDVGP